MKKTIIAIILSSLAIVVFSIAAQNYLETSSNKLVEDVEKMEVLVLKDDIEYGIKANILFEDKWNKTKRVWAVFIDHYEIDNIEECVVKTKMLMKEGEDKPQLLAEIETLKFYIAHIPKREKLNFQNIL